MSYELNARICLPAAMNNSQICELNVGRYQSLDFCRESMVRAQAKQPDIVSCVTHGLAMHYEVSETVGSVLFEVTYFIRAV